MKRAMISGGFDPLHVGHIELIEKAAQYGNVIVALNSDEWLYLKKGFVLMNWKDRARILEKIEEVIAVTPMTDSDGTACEALRRLRPDYFVNGGDRTQPHPDEGAVCKELGIKQIFGGEKIRSSSKIARPA